MHAKVQRARMLPYANECAHLGMHMHMQLRVRVRVPSRVCMRMRERCRGHARV